MTDMNERVAELQYEAGMYQSLYENAVKQRDHLVKALQDILTANVSFRAGMPDDWEGDLLQDACDAARLVINGVVSRAKEE